MKKAGRVSRNGMRKEYDFSGGLRGKHASRYAEGTTVVLLDSENPEHSSASTARDSQITELAGKHLLISQLTAGGLEVAVPVRDRGVDLVAYLDRGNPPDDFVACPIQVKSSTGEGFSLDRKYEKVPNLILAYVWHVGRPAAFSVYALSYAEALEVLRRKGHTKASCWKKGYWNISKADKQLVQLLGRYKMTPQKWADKVASVLRETPRERTA